MSPTSPPDWSAELQEALWQTGKEFGVHLEVDEQVAIARAVSRRSVEAATPEDVLAAFTSIHLRRPPAAFAKAVLASVKGITTSKTLLEVLVDYRRFAIRSLSGQFGGNTRGQEEELRNNLLTFLPVRGYTEARTGRGRTDILLPAPEEAIIEVKIWTTPRKYRDGVEELGRYIHTERPEQAYMIVFGDRDPLPSIVAEHRQELASAEHLEGLTVPVVVVPFEVDPASKAGAEERRRQRGK